MRNQPSGPTFNPAEVKRAKRGDAQAFAGLVEACAERVYRSLRRIVRDPCETEELFQEALTAAWLRLPSLRDENLFGPWLGAIALNLAKDRLRRNRRRQAIAEKVGLWRIGGQEMDHAPTVATRVWVAQGLEALPPTYREILTLYYWDDLTTAQIARITRRSHGATRRMLAKARTLLRQWVEGNG